MSFWKRLFGRGEAGGTPGVLGEESYKGYLIRALEMRAGTEYQLAGTIETTADETRRSQRFIRADRFGSRDEAARMALAKGRQIIEEQGERLFTP